MVQHALRWEDARRIAATLELMRSEPGVPLQPGDMDHDPWLLNVANGTIDLRTGELRLHQRDNLLMKQARRQSVKSQLGMAVQQEDQLGMKFEAAQK